MYFEGIKSRGIESYREAISSLSQETYLAELVEQSHRNAEIASEEFRFVRVAITLWFIGIIPWASTVYLLFQVRD